MLIAEPPPRSGWSAIWQAFASRAAGRGGDCLLFRWAVFLLPLAFLATGCPRRAAPPPPAPPVLRVWFLDVGQGDSALVLTPAGKSLLVDGGRQKAGPVV